MRLGTSLRPVTGGLACSAVTTKARRVLSVSIVTCAAVGAFGGGHAQASVTYGYDSMGRIRTALYDNNACIVYNYDAVGNLLSQTNYLPPQSTLPVWGTVSWANFDWSSSEQGTTWGSGLWGCAPWTP